MSASLQSLNLSLPFSRNLSCRKSTTLKKRVSSPSILCARKRDHREHDDVHKGKLVDENMIVLRLRIQEMMNKKENLQSSNGMTTMSDKWTEWERGWCKNYESDVFEIVGFLQRLLMNARPSMALGIVALLMLSVSTSLAGIVLFLLNFVLSIGVSGF